MKRCRHERAWAWRWTGDGWATIATIATIAPSISFGDRMTCVDCGHWLSLGPANDDGEHAQAVAVEVRGATLADNWREQSYRPGCDRFEWCPQNQSDELCDLCQAHVLAHAIAEHQTQDPTE